MIIALVTPYFPDEQTIDSGIANHYLLLAQSLVAAKNKVIVLHVRPRYQNEDDAFSKRYVDGSILVLTYKIKAPAIINRFFKHRWAIIDLAVKLKCMYVVSNVINKVIKQYGIRVIETSSYFSLCYFTAYKKIGAPIAVRVSTTFSQMMKDHYPFKSGAMSLLAKMELSYIKKSRYLITHARSHAAELEKLYNISAGRFQIIPHGVNLPNYDGGNTGNHSVTKILYTGRLEYRKGTDVLLRAIPLVIQKNTNVLFELIGNDPADEYQNKFTKDNPPFVTEKVIFKGRVDQLSLNEAYRTCDIFVAPSRYESFGLIFIEAMGFGKPAIGCPAGGVPEIIEDHKNGLFADIGDADSLADKINFLIENTELRKQMGGNARKTVEDKFTGKLLAERSSAYYQNIIADFAR